MSDHTSILCRQDREIVEGLIRREIPLSGNNDDVILRVVERMWAELEGWHRVANELAKRNLGPDLDPDEVTPGGSPLGTTRGDRNERTYKP